MKLLYLSYSKSYNLLICTAKNNRILIYFLECFMIYFCFIFMILLLIWCGCLICKWTFKQIRGLRWKKDVQDPQIHVSLVTAGGYRLKSGKWYSLQAVVDGTCIIPFFVKTLP